MYTRTLFHHHQAFTKRPGTSRLILGCRAKANPSLYRSKSYPETSSPSPLRHPRQSFVRPSKDREVEGFSVIWKTHRSCLSLPSTALQSWFNEGSGCSLLNCKLSLPSSLGDILQKLYNIFSSFVPRPPSSACIT